MKIIGLTGGMGSGKTTALKLFEKLGVPSYIADERGKYLLQNDAEIIRKVKHLLGEESYIKNVVNRKYIADKVFKNTSILQKLNDIVHPAVYSDFKKFTEHVSTKNYIVYETALLFESNSQYLCDKTILVVAPKNIRLQRILNRDNLSKDSILQRMQYQLPDEQKIPKADFIIENRDLFTLPKKIYAIHKKIMKIN